MTDLDWDKVHNDLSAPLDRAHVKPPPQGKYGEYVEAYHVIKEANRIFGFNGWSYSIDSLQKTNEEHKDGKLHVGYLAMVIVTVGGVHRHDVGHGQGHSKSEGDAHDSAVKEAVTDGLKRCLRTFGDPMGLALYDKTKANVQDLEAEAREATAIDEAVWALETCQDKEAYVEQWKAIAAKFGGTKNVPQPVIYAAKNAASRVGYNKETA